MLDAEKLQQKKTDLRAHMIKLRAAAKAKTPDAGDRAADNFMAAIPVPGGAIVSLFHSLPEEINTEPLIAALNEKGVTICLPVVQKKNAPLQFRIYQPGDVLIDGVFGVKTPVEDAPVVMPHIVVAPLLAFTRAGGRLGYGGGYYDRTLEQLRKSQRILAVGYGYATQEVDALPLTPLDQPADWIVTEREAIQCTG